MPIAERCGSLLWRLLWPWLKDCSRSWGWTPGANGDTFSNWLEQSRGNFDKLLWNGEYYEHRAGSGTPVVMADQLYDDFYARLLGRGPVVSEANSRSTLNAVKEACFDNFAGGSLDVANGLRRDGTPWIQRNPSFGGVDRHQLWTCQLLPLDG